MSDLMLKILIVCLVLAIFISLSVQWFEPACAQEAQVRLWLNVSFVVTILNLLLILVVWLSDLTWYFVTIGLAALFVVLALFLSKTIKCVGIQKTLSITNLTTCAVALALILFLQFKPKPPTLPSYRFSLLDKIQQQTDESDEGFYPVEREIRSGTNLDNIDVFSRNELVDESAEGFYPVERDNDDEYFDAIEE